MVEQHVDEGGRQEGVGRAVARRERQELTEARAKIGPAIRSISPQIRLAVEQAITAAAAAPASTSAPAVVAAPN